MARRQWGSGSLYQRKSDGRWIGRVSDGHGGHRYVTGTDKDRVKSRLRALSRSSPTDRSRERTGDVLQRWLDDARHLRARTRIEYQRMLRLHVDPSLGGIALGELRPQDVQRMVVTMMGAGLSAQTAKHALKLTRTGLAQAMRWGLVDRNVASLVKAPAVTRRPVTALTAAETRRFLDATRDEPLWPLWALAATTGMRQAELLGLRWQDVTDSTVTVNVTLRSMGDDEWALEEPKTRQSRRTLPLTPLGIEALDRQRRQATSALWVFARVDGRAMDRSRVTRLFQDALSRHGMPRIRFHDLRHGAAHMALDALGGDIRAVSALLGHSTIATTVDIYGGRADEARRRAAEAIGRALEGGTG